MSNLPIVSLPKYDLTLPCSKKKIKFRPFVVREEKLLLLAIQEEDTAKLSTAIKNALSSCAFGLDINSIPQCDAEYLFLNVRNKSMGEGIEAVSTCIHCEHKNYMMLDLSKSEIVMPEVELSSTIQLADNVWIIMRYPNMDDAYTMSEVKLASEITKVVANCVVSIVYGEVTVDPKENKIEELVEWLEDLSDENFTKITDFMANVPSLKFEQEYNCVKCGGKNLILLEGMESFFD